MEHAIVGHQRDAAAQFQPLQFPGHGTDDVGFAR